MSLNRPDERRRQAAEQAAEWLAALRLGGLSAKERSEHLEWLNESPLHIAEMLRVSQIDQALTECTLWRQHDVMVDNLTSNMPVTLGELKPALLASRSHRFPVRRWLPLAVALIVAVAGGTWMLLDRDQLVVRTQVGERREITLSDGSTVNIAPSTELSVRFEKQQRLINLKRGQAFFRVAKNPNRPFIVAAGSTSVRAVGTAFDVDRGSTNVTVTVVEGRVAVAHESPHAEASTGPGKKPPADLTLGANQQVVVTASEGSLSSVRAVNGAAEVAWTDDTLLFDNTPLGDVVRRFNLYNHAQIRILDPALTGRRVSGVFKASDPESLVEFVRSMEGQPSTQANLIRLDAESQ